MSVATGATGTTGATGVSYANFFKTLRVSSDTPIGINTLRFNKTNTGVGLSTLGSKNNENNTAIGFESGKVNTGNNNTYLGAKTSNTNESYVNSTAVGYNATITESNQVVLGGTNTQTVFMPYANLKFKDGTIQTTAYLDGTGLKGDTGPQGATGSSPWTTMNYQGPTGPGYKGAGYTGDVLIFGNLLVTGGIDPTHLVLTNNANSTITMKSNPEPGPATLFGLQYESTSNTDFEIKTTGLGNVVYSKGVSTKSVNIRDGEVFIGNSAPSTLQTTITNSYISVDDPANGLTCQFVPANVQVSNSSGAIGLLDTHNLNFLGSTTTTNISNSNNQTMDITGSGELNLTSTTSNINLNSAGYISATAPIGIDLNCQGGYFNAGDTFNTGNKTQINLLDSGSGFIALNTNTGRAILGDFNGVNNGYLFEANAGERFFTSNGGQASRCDEITIAGTRIEKYMNFVSTDVDVNLRPPIDYGNALAFNGEGWHCYIQNIGGNFINVNSLDRTEFVFGALSPTFVMNPYSTHRFTLTYWSPAGKYYWSVK
jgi:hypothetical protein